MGKVPIDVFVKTTSWNFWWSTYGFFKNDSEDFSITYKRNGQRERNACSIMAKGRVRTLYEHRYEQICKSTVEECCEGFDMSLDDLLETDKIIYGYFYMDPAGPDFYEVSHEAPRNEIGVKPALVEIYHPAEKVDVKVLKEATAKYCRDFLDLPKVKVHMLGRPRKGYAVKTWKEELELMKQHEEFVANGGKYEVRMLPQVVETLFPEEVAKINEEYEYAFIKDDGYYVKMKD